MRPRLAFTLPGTDTGGMERFLLRVLPALREQAELFVIVRAASGGALDAQFCDSGARIIYHPLGYFDLRAMLSLRRLLKRLAIDSFCDLSGIFGGVPLVVARAAGVRLRVAFHRRSTYAFNPSAARRLYANLSIRLIESTATSILSNSQYALDRFHPRLRAIGDNRLEVIRNIIDPTELITSIPRDVVRASLGIPNQAFVILHVGRVNPAKDHGSLLQALSGVMRRHTHVHGVLAGRETQSLVSHLAVNDNGTLARLHLLGDRRDVPELLAAADLFVFPSVTEGMPNALVEAMIAGLPVVTTAIPPICEIVPARGQEVLVPPASPVALEKALLACVESPAECEARKFGDEAKAMTAPGHVLKSLGVHLLGPAA